MNALQVSLLILVGVSAIGVVFNRDPLKQTLCISFYGILFGVLFFAFQAPDVALSQIVVGAVILPLMALLSLTSVKAEAERKRKQNVEKESA